MVSFSEPSENQTLDWLFFINHILEIYKAFQDRLTFLNRHMIVWVSWIFSICEIYWKGRTAGHLVFWKPWPVTGHRATAILYWFFVFLVLTEALFLIIAVQADNQPHSDFNISDFNLGINYGNLGRVIMLTVFEKFETVSNRVLFWGQVEVTL